MKTPERNIVWQYMRWHLDKSDKEIQQDLAEKKCVHCSLSTIKKYRNELAENKMLASELAKMANEEWEEEE